MKLHSIATSLFLAAGLVMTAGTAAAEKPASAPDDGAPARVAMTDDGPLFVTPDGWTLYTFGPDATRPGNPICTDEAELKMKDPTAGFGFYPLPGASLQRSCTEVWPPFEATAGASPSGDWSIVTRPNGLRQWAYRGKPVYTSIKDRKAGERNGSSKDASARRGWSFARPPAGFPLGLGFVRDAEALVIATADGRPAYTPRPGIRPAALCHDCRGAFEPVLAPAMAKFDGDWSTVDAGSGLRQLAYKGQPLFAAPEGVHTSEIAMDGNWNTVVYRELAPAPPQIRKMFTLLGEIYADKDGMTLYNFNCWTIGSSVNAPGCELPGGPATYWSALCGKAEACAKRWRPYLAEDGAKPSGEWTIEDVAYPMFTDPAGATYPPDTPRVKAWAYRGQPVYTYFEDKVPGDIWGNAIRWYGYSSFDAIPVPGRGALD